MGRANSLWYFEELEKLTIRYRPVSGMEAEWTQEQMAAYLK